LELDRSLATPPEPTISAEGQPLPTAHLDGAPEQCDLVTDLLAPEPFPHRVDVIDSRLQPPEPLGRRTPEPLDAAREGIQR